MPASISLLLAVVSGFITIQTFSPLQYRSRFQDWDRTLLESAFLGGVPVPFGGSIVAASALGLGTSLVGDWLLRALRLQDNSVRWSIRRYGGDLLALLVIASASDRLVSLTLRTGKVYVGYLARTPSITRGREVSIVPILSGYRDRESLELVFTTSYWEAHQDIPRQIGLGRFQHLMDRDLEVVVSLSDVLVANLFDLGLYEEYFGGRTPAEERASTHTH